MEGVKEIKDEVSSHFEQSYTKENEVRFVINSLNFKQLSSEDNSFLIAPFLEQEIREIIWIIRTRWDINIMKEDVVGLINEFHANGKLPKAITASFFTLIPKKDNPQSLGEYRLNCFVGCMYKILSKLMASRLKQVMGKLISNHQSAFLPGRNIIDGVIVLNAIVDLAKRRKDRCLLLKVDFEKAYDILLVGVI